MKGKDMAIIGLAVVGSYLVYREYKKAAGAVEGTAEGISGALDNIGRTIDNIVQAPGQALNQAGQAVATTGYGVTRAATNVVAVTPYQNAQIASGAVNFYSGSAVTGVKSTLGPTQPITVIAQTGGPTAAGQSMIEAAAKLTGFGYGGSTGGVAGGGYTPISGGAAFIPASASTGVNAMTSATAANQLSKSIASALATGRIA